MQAFQIEKFQFPSRTRLTQRERQHGLQGRVHSQVTRREGLSEGQDAWHRAVILSAQGRGSPLSPVGFLVLLPWAATLLPARRG